MSGTWLSRPLISGPVVSCAATSNLGSALEARIAATVHAVSEALDSLPQLQAGGLHHERLELAGAQVFEGVAHCGSLAVRRRLGPGARPLAHRLRARPTTVE